MATRIERETLREVGKTDKIVMSDQLNFFETLPRNEQIKDEKYSVHAPINPLDSNSGKSGSTISFRVMGDVYFIDLSKCYFILKLKIFSTEKTILTTADKYSVVNLLSFSIIKNMELKINDKVVTPSYHTFPFKMYFNTMLSHGFDSKHSKLQALGFAKDTVGHFDTLMAATLGNPDKLTSENKGAVHRRELFDATGVCELFVPLAVDLAQQPNLLFNKLKLEVNLLLNSKEFVILCADTAKFDFMVTDIKFYVKKVELSAETLTALEATLADYPARYFYNERIVRILTLTSGQANFWFDPLVTGKLPLRAIVAFNTSEAVNGKYSLNPFNFEHHKLSELRFVLNGKKFPSYDIKPDFNNNEFIQYFMELHHFAGADLNTPYALDITKKEFHKGYTFFAVSFTPELVHDFLLQPPLDEGPMRIDVSFKENLTVNLSMVLWLEYPQRYVITSTNSGVKSITDTRL